MAFGREDVSVAGTDRGADVFGLAGFLRNYNLVGHTLARLEESIRPR
jgi:hypothetical protein